MSSGTNESGHSPRAREARGRVRGIALMCGAVACFSGIDACAKYLNSYLDIVQIVWARYTFAFFFSFAISNPIARPTLMRTKRPWLQFGRSFLLIASTALNIVALRHLQLDQTVSIMFSTPLLVALLAGMLLGEWVSLSRWVAISIGFIGVLVVMRPGVGGIHPAAIFTVAGTILYSIYMIATRVLARTDSTETTVFYSNVVGFVGTTLLLPLVWSTPQSWTVAVIMIAIGAFGALGHYLLIAGHRLAPAPVLAPFIYTQIVWMVALGYIFFGNVPSAWTLAGAAIVICSGLYLLLSERGVDPRKKPGD
jgi:drug/metabolite transporter (DMT)-like permease